MSKPPQARLDSAGDDWNLLESLAGPLGVGQGRPVGPQTDSAARRVGIVVAHLPVGRVMVDHRVHVARADREEEPRATELTERLTRVPVRL